MSTATVRTGRTPRSATTRDAGRCPPRRRPHELWLRAVVAGGQGRYGSALADLAGGASRGRVGPLVSLAHSTRASFLRQLGWHDRARAWDGRASALARCRPRGAVPTR